MFRKKKKPVPNDPVTIMKSFVDPTPILDAEFDRAKRELLAAAEQDMSIRERVRFRRQLLTLRHRFRALRNWQARW